ncbi:MAG TPA: hypothetical protein VGC79_28805 [Polyangiaceae bacterium]
MPADGPAHLPPEDAPRSVLAVFPLAGLLAVVSSIGILSTSVYARETANWRGQAIAQDWVDLLLTVPWLTSAAVLASRGSRRGSLLLAAGLLYTFYEFVIYGFALHFNALFLPYCAILGVCFFALIGLGIRYVQEDVGRWYPPATPVRFAGVTLLAVGLLFAFAWLAEILPALVSGELPASVAEAGTVTNPVYLIDLSIVLPAHLLAGRSLLRRRTLGLVLAPILLGFDVLMALSLAAMMGIMAERGLPSSLAAAAGMLGLAVISGLSLWLLLRGVRSAL